MHDDKDHWCMKYVPIDQGWDWHDGHGWYLIHDEYPEEGSVGAFRDRSEAMSWVVATDGVIVGER